MMPHSIGTPRVLLRRLREIMAEPDTAQARLDRIVQQVAGSLVAEVSSIYVRRPDGSLELFATEGLNRSAVHKTRLRRREGLVGQIAETGEHLNLPNAPAHPAFSFRPETGEDPFSAFLGVPILRGGHTLGVLTIQNKAKRFYSEEELEALQTTAMLLAEIIAAGGHEDQPEAIPGLAKSPNVQLRGMVLSDGLALGHVVLHEPRVVVTNLIAENPRHEAHRLEAGMIKLRSSIDELLQRGEMARAGEHREVLEAFRLFAHDRGWFERMMDAVRTGLTAEAAVERVQADTRAKMMRNSDVFWRERLDDLEDLSNRLLRILAGRTATAAAEDLPKDTILVARSLGAAELLDYDRTRLRGLVLEEGAAQSHVAIVARAIGIPAVGQVPHILNEVDPGDAIVLDAEAGDVHVRPNGDLIAAYSEKARFRAKRQLRYRELRDRPALTLDSQRIQIQMNAGLLVDLPHLEESGADGIGLFRTELQFMVSSTFPRLERQTQIYRSVLEAAGDRPVVFRSLDIGGDKVLPYMRHAHEENPALGWRAIRMALDRPGLFRTQVRALLRAAAGRELRVMLPMISDVEEYTQARALIEKERAHLARHGHGQARSLKIGAMLEVPALLFQLDQLMPNVDFISVGSNDLLQFLYAADRGNVRVAGRFDPLNPPVLRALREITRAAKRYGTPLTLCGEMAGRPLEAMALIGIGFRSISMSPAAIGPVKSMILGLDAGALEAAMNRWLENGASSVRPLLAGLADDMGVAL